MGQIITQVKNKKSSSAEKLSGDREGQHSILINDQWQICFIWRQENAYDVEIVDYHRVAFIEYLQG